MANALEDSSLSINDALACTNQRVISNPTVFVIVAVILIGPEAYNQVGLTGVYREGS